jgi:hypothetical protein
MQTIDVTIQGVALDYACASAIAQRLTAQAAGETLLLAWFDAKNNAGHPDVRECTGNKPGWLAYAESHGGNLAVNVNGGEFVFVFATGLENRGG